MKIKLLHKWKITLICGTVLIFIGIGAHCYWLDGVSGFLWELTLGETIFAPNYREFKYRRVVEGMTGAQVKVLLGETLRVRATKVPGEVIWYYTNPKVWEKNGFGADCFYTVRNIVLNNDVVSLKYHEFYFD